MVRMVNLVRLAGFPFSLGMTGALVTGTLNRVLIVELGLPNVLVGLLLTGSYFMLVPFRVWFGHRSDAYPVFGLRREPFIILGALVSGVGLALAAALALGSESLGAAALIGIFGGFVIFGLGKHASSNQFEALLADKFSGDARPRAVTTLKVALFVGAIGTGIGLGRLLEEYNPGLLLGTVIGTAALAFVLSTVAAVRQEPRERQQEFIQASEEARQMSFVQALRTVIWPDPQVRIFFLLVSLTVLGTLAQEIFLEPFGGLVLGMEVNETARLQSYWGTGVMITMLSSGLWLIKRFGYMPILRAGIVLSALALLGLIVAGAAGSVGLFIGLVFVIGLGTGFATAGLLTAVIEFTTVARAGLLMGVWGVAHELGETLGNVGGGLVVDVGNVLTGSYLAAYGALFGLEAIVLVVALVLSRRVKISEARVWERLSPAESAQVLAQAPIPSGLVGGD